MEEEEEKVGELLPSKKNSMLEQNLSRVKKNVERRLTFDERMNNWDSSNVHEIGLTNENAHPNMPKSQFLFRSSSIGEQKLRNIFYFFITRAIFFLGYSNMYWKQTNEYKKSLETTPNRQVSDINTINYLTVIIISKLISLSQSF